MHSPDFWNNREKVQKIVNKLKHLKEITSPFQGLQKSLEDITLLTALAEEDDEKEVEELTHDLNILEERLSRFELQLMLNGPNDGNNAYLSIHAGAGGTEACDWAAMLLRMYSRWVERHNYSQDIMDSLAGEEAGIRRVTLHIKGKNVYGYLRPEIGVHRLVRISPFDANARRHTSFAAVDALPEIEDDKEIEINDNEMRIDTYRSSGAGGQHVNKTSSAVRITHLPTGIVVQCQNERSQHKNKKMAMSMLKSRLYQLKEKEREKELAAFYDEKGDIAWGNQIRSYVLHPYSMIKDLRTGMETSNTQAFLDGDIDIFIKSYLKWDIGR